MALRRSQINYIPVPAEPDSRAGLSPGVKRGLVAGGVGVGIPGYLYARGIRSGGIPWRQVPGTAWGQVKGLKSYDIASALRAGTISTGKDIGSIGPRIWKHVKGTWAGLAGKKLSSDTRLIQLNQKLDSLIQFQAPEPQAVQRPTVIVIRRPGIIEKRDEDKKGISAPKLAALYGAGGITGAGIATGNAATRGFLTRVGRNLQRAAKQLRK